MGQGTGFRFLGRIKMEGNTYIDMFSTKGVEYLLMIGFLVLIVFFLRALTRDRSKGESAKREDSHEAGR
jgi:hypothetical protein